MQIRPQPQTNELIQRCNELKESSPFLIKETDFAWKKLVRDANDILKVEAWAGWAVLGTIYSLTGNAEEMNRSFRASLRLANDWITVANWIGNLVNLGYVSEAQEVFAKHARPEDGNLRLLFEGGMHAHAFHAVLDNIKKAKAMHIQNAEDFPINEVSDIVNLLDEIGFTDQDIARHLDIAGEIIRKRNVSFPYADHFHNIPGVREGLTIAIACPFNDSEIFDMNIELAMEEDKQEIKKHQMFDVAFAKGVWR